jgi:hypothetical protein
MRQLEQEKGIVIRFVIGHRLALFLDFIIDLLYIYAISNQCYIGLNYSLV